MYQFLVSFTVQPEHRDDFVFGAFFAEGGAYAQGPTWPMRRNVVGDKAVA